MLPAPALGVCGLAYLVLGLPLLTYLLWVDVVNVPTHGITFLLYAILDASLRLVAALLLVAGSIQLIRRRRIAASLLVAWAVIRLTWPAVSAAIAVAQGEVSPELIAIALPVMITFSTAPLPAAVVLVITWWVVPPLVVLVWLWRHRDEISRWTPARRPERDTA